MKRIISNLLVASLGFVTVTSCIEEAEPQNSFPSANQVANAPGVFEKQVAAITDNLSGKYTYSGSDHDVYDFGYTSFFLMRDVQGQDIIPAGTNNWYVSWYNNVKNITSQSALAQYPWTYYYGWILNCNNVIKAANAQNYATPEESRKHGVGIAYAMRAMFHFDMARLYATKPYSVDHNALTTIKADEIRTVNDAMNQERMTWDEAFDFILKDLDKAEEYLADYHRSDVYTPDVSVVYGLKARVYLEKQDWANAEKYAKLAQNGYQVMTESQYLDRDNGFNTPNSSWMFATRFLPTDPCIKENDGDGSWGSVMILENGFECGYAQNYGGVNVIDKHLYSTIPTTDFRKKCWVDFSINDMTQANAETALSAYSNYPDRVYQAGQAAHTGVGGLSLKFRNAAGKADVKYDAWCVSVPLMRVEEMKLIEAEAAGMQDLARGKQLLTAFAQTRDPNYQYGKHNEAYYNNATSEFQNEVWWQRRVELWGEGFATFDIKRLNKGIIRSYAGTNHTENARWNVNTLPNWMVAPFVDTESAYNGGMTQNPDPTQPSSDSAPYVW